MRGLKKALAISFGVLFSTVSLAAPQWQSAFGHYNSLSANFTQKASMQGQTLTSSGVLLLKKPNQFLWKVVKPSASEFVSDGKQLWHYEPDLLQVIVRPLVGTLSQTPILLLSGQVKDLDQTFNITDEGNGEFTLVPKGEDSFVAKVQIRFKNQLPEHLRLVSQMGQITDISLSDIKVNPKFKSDAFHFTPPKGVDVYHTDSATG